MNNPVKGKIAVLGKLASGVKLSAKDSQELAKPRGILGWFHSGEAKPDRTHFLRSEIYAAVIDAFKQGKSTFNKLQFNNLQIPNCKATSLNSPFLILEHKYFKVMVEAIKSGDSSKLGDDYANSEDMKNTIRELNQEYTALNTKVEMVESSNNKGNTVLKQTELARTITRHRPKKMEQKNTLQQLETAKMKIANNSAGLDAVKHEFISALLDKLDEFLAMPSFSSSQHISLAFEKIKTFLITVNEKLQQLASTGQPLATIDSADSDGQLKTFEKFAQEVDSQASEIKLELMPPVDTEYQKTLNSAQKHELRMKEAKQLQQQLPLLKESLQLDRDCKVLKEALKEMKLIQEVLTSSSLPELTKLLDTELAELKLRQEASVLANNFSKNSQVEN